MAEQGTATKTGLTVLGILCVLLGLLFVLASFWGLLQPLTIRQMTEQHGAPQILTGIGHVWAYVHAGLFAVLGSMLFVAGIGLLHFKAWGAKLAILYAYAQIGLSVLGFVMAFLGPIANRPTPQQLQELQKLPQFEATVKFLTTQFMSVAVTEVLGALLLSIAFPVILLCLLSRSSYRQNLSSK